MKTLDEHNNVEVWRDLAKENNAILRRAHEAQRKDRKYNGFGCPICNQQLYDYGTKRPLSLMPFISEIGVRCPNNDYQGVRYL